MSRIKDVPFLDKIYPQNKPLKEIEADILIRSATFICSTYAYRRLLLPPEAFEFVQLRDIRNLPFFKKQHPRAAAIRQSLASITEQLKDKKVVSFFFGVLREGNKTDIVECLRFSFDYTSSAMVVTMPNAITVRVESRWDFADDLNDVLDKIRMLCDYLRDIPPRVRCAVMLHCKSDTAELPKNFAMEKYDTVQKNLDSLPIAHFPCNENNFGMVIELRSRYFDVPVNEIDEELEAIRKTRKRPATDEEYSPDVSRRHSPAPDESHQTTFMNQKSTQMDEDFDDGSPQTTFMQPKQPETDDEHSPDESPSSSSVAEDSPQITYMDRKTTRMGEDSSFTSVNHIFYRKFTPLDSVSVAFNDVKSACEAAIPIALGGIRT